MKTCRTCNELKPADAYRGTRSACRECEKARRREWYAAQAVKPYQRPKMKAYYRQWYAVHAESVKARAAVSKARLDGVRANWVPSLGFDQVGRARALQDAADKGRIPHDYPMLAIYREQVEAPRIGGPASVASLLPMPKP